MPRKVKVTFGGPETFFDQIFEKSVQIPQDKKNCLSLFYVLLSTKPPIVSQTTFACLRTHVAITLLVGLERPPNQATAEMHNRRLLRIDASVCTYVVRRVSPRSRSVSGPADWREIWGGSLFRDLPAWPQG